MCVSHDVDRLWDTLCNYVIDVSMPSLGLITNVDGSFEIFILAEFVLTNIIVQLNG